GTNPGSMAISSNVTITLSGTDSGTPTAFDGIAVAQNRNAAPSTFNNGGACQTGCNQIYSNDALTITGALYFPDQWLNYASNNYSSTCTQLIANYIQFNSNNVTLQANCQNAGTVAIGGSGTATSLVE